ncbi:MAG: hypothetical protein ABI183_11060, partial [Polyangiaceae bacterium]
QKNPDQRFQKISKLAAALDEFVTPLESSGAGARLGLVQPSDAPPPTPPIAWRPASYVMPKARAAAAVPAETMEDIPALKPPASGLLDDDLPTGKSKIPAWPFVAAGAAVIGAAIYFAIRAPVAPIPTISGDPGFIDAASTSSTSMTVAPAAASLPVAPPNVSASSDRSHGVIPSSTSNATGKGISPLKGTRGGHDAGNNEGRLLDTR